MNSSLPCPCGSARAYGACCGSLHGEHLRQLAVVNEPRASGTDLERTDWCHAGATAATYAILPFSPFGGARFVTRDLLPSPSEPTSAADSGSKPKGDLRDGNHGHVAMPNGLVIDVANAEVSFEELRDRLDRGGGGCHRC